MSFLTKDLGPFPVYAWLGGAAVLVVAFIYFKRSGSSASTTASTTPNYAVAPSTASNPNTVYPPGAGVTQPSAQPIGPTGIAKILPKSISTWRIL